MRLLRASRCFLLNRVSRDANVQDLTYGVGDVSGVLRDLSALAESEFKQQHSNDVVLYCDFTGATRPTLRLAQLDWCVPLRACEHVSVNLCFCMCAP